MAGTGGHGGVEGVTPMSDFDAMDEARRRWGARAEVAHEMTCVELYMVGEQLPGAEMPEWHGIGRTWELAFREADERAAKSA